jgi:hypothetical protein
MLYLLTSMTNVNMKLHLFTLFCFVILTSSCKENPEEKLKEHALLTFTIDHSNQDKIMVSELAKDVITIPLETSSRSLVSMVADATLTENHLYLLDLGAGSPRVLQFERNGKFLKTIGNQGEGPEEFRFLTAIFYDEENSQICLIDGFGKKILQYSPEGNFIAAQSTSSQIAGIYQSNRGKLIFENTFVDPYQNNFISRNQLKRVDEQFDPNDSLPINIHLKKPLQLVYRHPNFVFQQDSTLFLFVPTLLPEIFHRDTLFQVTGNFTLKPFAKFRFTEMIEQNGIGDNSGFRDIQVSEKHFFITYYYQKESYVHVIDRKSKQGISSKGGLWLSDGQGPFFPKSKAEGWSYLIQQPEKRKGEPEPNPTLVWIKWK